MLPPLNAYKCRFFVFDIILSNHWTFRKKKSFTKPSANKKIAPEHNGTIISKTKYKKKFLKNKDNVEIVHFIGGG